MSYRLGQRIYFCLFILLVSLSSASGKTYIIYTANINGSIQNCKCGSNPLGGLDRLKSFIDEFKKNHLHTVVIDGGDFFNSYPFPELNSAMLNAIPLLNYDIMVPGENAFLEPGLFAKILLSLNQDQMLISNAKNNEIKYRLFHKQNAKIYIWSYLSPDIFSCTEKAEELVLDELKIPAGLKEKNSSVYVLIYHGAVNNLKDLLKENPEIDLVLVAHDQQKGTLEIAGKKVVCTGRDGEVVVIIEIDNISGAYSIQVDYHDINLELPADPAIKDLIMQYKSEVMVGRHK
jgi:2',3'-cyclic-nucleotide 2'-phosphodiesterase (5'-nucleotidase family)